MTNKTMPKRGLWRAVCRDKWHVRFGGRSGETHRQKCRQGAPGRPYPDDPNEPPWDKLPAYKRHHKAMWNGQRWVSDRRALAELVRAGFTSAAAVCGDWTATVTPKVDEGAEAAIDQILISPALAAAIVPESYRVHVGRSAELASDHRMVSVVLDLDRVGSVSTR